MKLIKEQITTKELKEMSKKMNDFLVKAVIDIDKEIMVVDVGLHSDGMEFLIEQGSEIKDLWGINLWPNEKEEKFIEFDSIINIKPVLNNRTRGIESKEIRNKIIEIVKKLVKNDFV